MKFGVLVFPGSNCDHDAYHVLSKHVGQPVDFVWHKETDLSAYDAIIVPGGFSYGDYLACRRIGAFFACDESDKGIRRIRENLFSVSATVFKFCVKRICFRVR